MGLLDDILNSYGGGGLLGSIPAPQAFAAPQGNQPMTDTERQLMAMVQPQPQAAPPMFAQAPPQQPMTDTERQMMAMVQPPMTPTEQKLMAMVRPGAGAGEARPQDSLPMTPTERQMMAMVQPSGAAAPPPAPPQAPRPPQAGPIAIGDYMMPRIGPASAYAQQASPTDVSARAVTPDAATPTGTPAAFMSPPSSGGFGGFGRGALANMQGGPLGMLFGGIAGAAGMGQGSPQDVLRQNQKAQYEALIANGLTPQRAMLAILNPEAGKTLIQEALTNKAKWGEIGTDAFGSKTMGFIDENNQTVNGKPIGAGAATAEGMTGGLLAPGVKAVDSSLSGADYLNQFSPEVQSSVRNYVAGKSTPTGNPRKGFTQAVKMIAQKYGDDTGQSVDDASFAARKQMRNQLSSSAPSSLGGQINIGNTAAGHLADLTQKAIELGNYDMGLAPLTSVVNNVRGLATEQAAKMEALKGAAQHYGQEITKFYAGSPGGTAERDRFIESVNGARSPKELAAILSTEGELMRSRLDALGGQIKGVLGDEGMKEYPVLRPDGQAALAKVEENVSKLKGGAQPAAPAIKEGATATNPKTGQQITFRNGQWQ